MKKRIICRIPFLKIVSKFLGAWFVGFILIRGDPLPHVLVSCLLTVKGYPWYGYEGQARSSIIWDTFFVEVVEPLTNVITLLFHAFMFLGFLMCFSQ